MRLCVVTGEASGDLHASEVIRELRSIDPSFEGFGLGGDLLAGQGVEILHHVSELGIVGLFNVLRHLRMFRRVFDDLIGAIADRRPDAVLLVDYPDFNLRVAKRCRRLGIPVVYYISPQVWAWRRRRVKTIARWVDHMIVIFPFEESFYRLHGVPVTYVGHPLIEQLESLHNERLEVEAGRPLRLALLPGSRRMEVAALLPAMLEAVRLLGAERRVDAFVIKAPTIQRVEIESLLQSSEVEVRVVDQGQREALVDADLALSSSGTATLECAVLGVPVVVMYRLSRGTYALARWLVRLPNFSLVNIVAGRRLVPELLQNEVTGLNLAAAVRDLLQAEEYRQVKLGLNEVREKLGSAGASLRTAEKIATLVEGWSGARGSMLEAEP